MSKKRYAVGCTAPEDWEYIHEELSKDGSLEDNIPSESITVDDLKEHSRTRAVYMLTDDEATELKKHPKVLYVDESHEDQSPPADELVTMISPNVRGWFTTILTGFRNDFVAIWRD